MIIIKFWNVLAKKCGDFLSKTIHSTGMPIININIRNVLFFKTFTKDSCSVGLGPNVIG